MRGNGRTARRPTTEIASLIVLLLAACADRFAVAAEPPVPKAPSGSIPYCALKAMVEGSGEESNAYAILVVLPDDSIQITGFRTQKSHGLR
jgi:hypothetical protein